MQPDAPEIPQGPRRSWDDEKKEFSKEALQEVLNFLRKDNEIVGHIAIMTNAFATYFAQNPEAVADLFRHMGYTGKDFEVGGGDLAGGGWAEDLFSFIRDFLTRDKELIEKIVSKIFGL